MGDRAGIAATRRRVLLALPLLALLAHPAPAQKLNPVRWSVEPQQAAAAPGSKAVYLLTARLDPGWHLYGLNVPKPIISTSIRLGEDAAIASTEIYQPKPHTIFDPNFGFNVDTYEKEAVFRIEVGLAKSAPPGPLQLTFLTRWQACNNKMCLPPRRAESAATLLIDPGARAAPIGPVPPGYTRYDPNARPPAAAPGGKPSAASSGGLLMFILVAFGFGLAAIFTPCVFPMIPITVSYFLNKPAGGRGRSLGDALLFSSGIVVLFSALGLAATAILGPFGVVQLGSNVWVNGFVALVFLVFGVSLLGAFEITIPSGVLTRLNRASQGGGVLGTLLMGLTFSLSAFACVGPFVGTLLAASVSGGGSRPFAGMLAFAVGLATPFFFLALFPSYLKRLPKSGGWLERVKVVMGFLVLAAMFKYLSDVDRVMQWNLLTRERFLAAWIVLFALAGLYLLGLLRLRGGGHDDAAGPFRLLLGAAFVAFSLSLVPGMFGARLGELDAYVPPPSSASLSAPGESLHWMKNQYHEALVTAREQGKRVFVSFSGYACTNCHWMQANMFTRPEIAAAMKDYVLVELYTDGTDAASAGNQALEQAKFSTVAIPYYAILDPDEKVVASFPGLTRDPAEFLRFLRSGAEPGQH
jgi:thiol:disulfide interchange protein